MTLFLVKVTGVHLAEQYGIIGWHLVGDNPSVSAWVGDIYSGHLSNLKVDQASTRGSGTTRELWYAIGTIHGFRVEVAMNGLMHAGLPFEHF